MAPVNGGKERYAVTDFDSMSHEQIYQAVKAGQLDALKSAQATITSMHKTVTDHMTAMDTILKQLNGAWTDPGGDRLYNAMSKTVSYVHEIQRAHVVESSGSITQVMASAHEKLASTQTTMPEPPAVPVDQQRENFDKAVKAQGDAMSMRTANMLTQMSKAQADDKKAVAMAKALANTYKAEAAKMNTPEPTPKTGANLPGGSGTQPTGHPTGSTGTTTISDPGPHTGVAPVKQVTTPTDGGHVTQLPPDPNTGSHSGTDGNAGNTGGTGADDSSNVTTTGFGNYGGSGGSTLSGGVLTGALAIGGAAALAKAAAAARAQQMALTEQRALAQQELTGEESQAMSFQRQAALNAQQRGILASEQGMMSQEQRMLAAQQRSMMANERGALTAEERAMMAAGQRGVVPGQLGGKAGAGATGARTAGRGGFSPHGVVGGEGAERVTWLVEDRDLYDPDPGVKPVLDD